MNKISVDIAERIYSQFYKEQGQESFYKYRQIINKKFIPCWFHREMSHHLEQFYYDLLNGKRPILIIESPPQHGKSEITVDFISWIAGKHPDFRTIFASFSERLGIRANLRLQRIYDSKIYKIIFPETKINSKNVATISGQNIRNREMIEYVGTDGYFRNTTVQGSVTGESLDLGVIDDPIKGREAAGSPTIRNKVWDWFLDDFYTRFSESAGLLCVLTRWHIDDPIGRLIDVSPKAKILKYKAVATEDEDFRREGEALFPELKSLDFLMTRKEKMLPSSWESLYQQSPSIQSGNFFKGDGWQFYKVLPENITVKKIFVDTAQKIKEHNDYTVFQCWGKAEGKGIFLIDQFRSKIESPDLKINLMAFWRKNLGCNELVIEDASAGSSLIQEIRRKENLPIRAIQRQKSKQFRATNTAPHINAGNVFLPEDAHYLAIYLEEFRQFAQDDTHLHDDMVDCTMDAIESLLMTPSYNINAWSRK